jgi:hypothetical protein
MSDMWGVYRDTYLTVGGDADGMDEDEGLAEGSITPLLYSAEMKSTPAPKRGTKAEFVAIMALIAEIDRDEYRELRREAWETISLVCSLKPN